MIQTLIAHPEYDALRFAFDAAREAGVLVRQMAQAGINASRKADRSLVTEADLAADTLITQRLTSAFPGDGVLSEESGSTAAGRRHVWVVDPIDGTKAYAAQIPGYSVMIGRLNAGRPTLGVVYNPETDVSYFALDGAGAWWIEGPDLESAQWSQVSDLTIPEEMRLITTPSMSADKRELALTHLGLRDGPTINSVGVKVGLLITNHGDVYYSQHKLSYWDTVAPLVIAHEAGGRATLLDGSELTYDLTSPPTSWEHPGPVLITNGTQHDTLRERFRSFAALVERHQGANRTNDR